MHQTEHSITELEQQTPTETRDVGDAIDVLHHAGVLTELLRMAGNSIWQDGSKVDGEAVMTGADLIAKTLKEARGILYANLGQGGAQ